MRKRIYVVPQIIVVVIAERHLLAGSQHEMPANDPEEEVDAGEALSRKNFYLWAEDEEE
jgi:hypothetical protein